MWISFVPTYSPKSLFVFQPRILMAMARDGLLPSYFSYVNQRTQVPINGTITTGVCAAILAFFMDVSQLAGMVIKMHYDSLMLPGPVLEAPLSL